MRKGFLESGITSSFSKIWSRRVFAVNGPFLMKRIIPYFETRKTQGPGHSSKKQPEVSRNFMDIPKKPLTFSVGRELL